ncbi:MAG TPA: acyltransferase, partial [Candidatus Paceibacterota bacterium]|nr:acyltransferase [Candidatus Paceibacterota bacterium]
IEMELWSPVWTLCYEEQFYFVVGVALLLARRIFFPALTFVTAVVLLGQFFFRFNTLGTFLDGKWLMFASGVLAYYILNRVPPEKQVWYCIPFLLGSLAAFSDPKQMLRGGVGEPNQSYLTAFVFGLAIVGLSRWDIAITSSRLMKPLRFLGEMCYSLYLVHWPVVMVVGHTLDSMGISNPFASLLITVPCSIGVTILLGRCFHLWVERRFWNSKSAMRDRPTDRPDFAG